MTAFICLMEDTISLITTCSMRYVLSRNGFTFLCVTESQRLLV